MLIQKIKISNFKTYLSLDLDLTVDDDRPIILIGGSNGGGKTTLFEAISGALYGLKIESKEHFMELLNQGAINKVKPEISLQITFVGKVLGQQQKYILKRIYQLNPQGRPLESVSLNMNGNMYVADDLELAGRGSSVTLQGNYYGYNFQKNYGAQDPDSAKKAEFSSAMMVNGKSSHLDIKGLNYLLLAGRTFISRKLDASNEDILMGESISARTNQLAYYVPLA